jgi:GT2 family glycosyltransferase/glycosyltransferase involved in cell wall biosynthesis
MNPTQFPLCSILIVNYNGKPHLERCLRAFEQLRYPSDRVELFIIDNGSDDGSEMDAQAAHPQLRLLRNAKNNFAAALNLGISQAQGAFVAFANNDVFVEPDWLSELVRVLEANQRAGCAGGKILFENGRINSVGHQALPGFYWQDEGFNQEDRGQYDREREVEGHSWAAVLFRKSCLEDVGPIDEDYVLYYEDVDTSLQCRKKGWKILYTPGAVARHVFHGSSRDPVFVEYFCDRSRLIFISKHCPEKLPAAAGNSRLLAGGKAPALHDTFLIVFKKLVESHPPEVVAPVLDRLTEVLAKIYGALAVDHLLGRLQVILGRRRISVGFYDQALHFVGGGQRYGCTIASELQNRFDVSLISSGPVTLQDLESWYGIPLSRCRLEVVPLPYFGRLGGWIDANAVTPDAPNPFDAIAAQSQKFDFFINVNQLPMVCPLSPFSLFLCHFPDVERRCFFWAGDYSCLVVNSLYTGEWVRRLWGLDYDLLLYPPVDLAGPPREKEKVILSVARFEIGGSKKQLEMIEAFCQLRASHPDLLRGWRLLLVGGSTPGNPYLQKVIQLAAMRSAQWGEAGVCAPLIEVKVNVPFSELQDLYARAKIFWHACGLGETDPHLIEHFGMTTVEAMQNRCVPIVIDGGGQREIVDHGKCGYRFATAQDLRRYTVELIESPGRMREFQEAACKRAERFSGKCFAAFIRDFFQKLEAEYRTIPAPDPRDLLEGRNRVSLFYSALAARRGLRHGSAGRGSSGGSLANSS